MDPYFLLLTSAAWVGIALASIDVAKKHVTRKAHADVGMRVCDYPTIQVRPSCLCTDRVLRQVLLNYLLNAQMDSSCVIILRMYAWQWGKCAIKEILLINRM